MPNYRRLFIDNSYLFITIVTSQRKSVLIENISLLQESFKEASYIYKFEIYAISILPEHLHMILIPENINDYPKIIRAIKYNFSEKINAGGIAIPPYEKKSIWQKRYYEHTLRDDEDLNKHLDYIHYNPVKHGLVKQVKNWEFSSFHKFVEIKNYDTNWGNFQDIEKIKDLNYE